MNTNDVGDELIEKQHTFVENSGEKKIAKRSKKPINFVNEGEEQLLASNVTAKFVASGVGSQSGMQPQAPAASGGDQIVEEKVSRDFRVVSFRKSLGPSHFDMKKISSLQKVPEHRSGESEEQKLENDIDMFFDDDQK